MIFSGETESFKIEIWKVQDFGNFKFSPYIEMLKTGACMLYTGPDKAIFVHTIVIIFLSISLNMCFGCSKFLLM